MFIDNRPFTSLGLIPVGSVWKGGSVREQIRFDATDVTVSFSEGRWRHLSVTDLRKDLPDYSWLSMLNVREAQASQLIEFHADNGLRVYVPCNEFLARCYARSAEVNRVIITYRWDEVRERLFRPITKPPPRGCWAVKLCDKAYNSDAVFLAHLWNDPYAAKVTKSLYAQLESAFNEKSNGGVNAVEEIVDGLNRLQHGTHVSRRPAHGILKVAPWFQGQARIAVEGIHYGKQFLALRVVGMSEPNGAAIHKEREHSNKGTVDEEADLPATAWSGTAERSFNPVPPIVNLTHEFAAGRTTQTIDIATRSFVVLGTPRLVVERPAGEAKSRAGPRVDGGNPSAHAPGERFGSNQDTGHASIHTPITLESQGALRDVWNGLQQIAADNREQIKSVNWYCPDRGFQNSEPELLRFELFDKEEAERLSKTTREWPLVRIDTAGRRGALVVRVESVARTVFIVEIQRRSIRRKDEKDEVKVSEQAFSGLVVAPEDEKDLELKNWLPSVLSMLRHAHGVFGSVLTMCPPIAHTFVHRKSASEKVAGEAAARNALSKVGINLKGSSPTGSADGYVRG